MLNEIKLVGGKCNMSYRNYSNQSVKCADKYYIKVFDLAYAIANNGRCCMTYLVIEFIQCVLGCL